MVRHVILWKLKDMPEAEKTAVKAGIKAGLEGLAGQIPGLLEVHVYTDALPSSANADLMLDTTFTDEAALKGYAVHPAHVAVADGKVRPYTAVRTCLATELFGLDAVMFLNPRNSQVDVVQSVGRVMRRAKDKDYGYIILPVGIPSGVAPEAALKDSRVISRS